MYSRYAERRGWQVEIISQSLSDIGGYKEIIAKIIGQGAYSRLKFESWIGAILGDHRAKLIPRILIEVIDIPGNLAFNFALPFGPGIARDWAIRSPIMFIIQAKIKHGFIAGFDAAIHE